MRISPKRYGTLSAVLLTSAFTLAGCRTLWNPFTWNAFLDPSKTIAVADDERELIAIFEHLDPLEEQSDVYPNSVPPSLEDLEWSDADYLVGASDVLNIGVMDLHADGQESPLVREVSNEGYIQLPYIPERIKVEGLTTHQVAELVANRYQGDYLLSPVVNVTAVEQRQTYFSIAGAISRPNQYPIPRREFRLLEAIALAGDVNQSNLEYVYVIRKTDAAEMLMHKTGPSPSTTAPKSVDSLPPLPGTQTPIPARPTTPFEPTTPVEPTTPAAPKSDLELELEKFMPGSNSAPAPVEPAAQVEPTATAVTVPVVEPVATPAVKPVSPVEAEMQRLEDMMTPAAPAPLTRPVKPVVLHMSDTASGGAAGSASGSGGGRFVWMYKNDEWVRVPVATAATQPAPVTAPVASPAPAPVATPVAAEPVAVPVAAAPITADPVVKTTPAVPVATPAPAPAPAMEMPRRRSQPAAPVAVAPRPRRARRAVSVPAQIDPDDPFGWAQADMSKLARVIAIDLNKLKEGDPRQNIIIREGDTVIVPPLKIGYCYIMGEVLRPSTISLTGRKMTIKQALAEVGGLNGLAWPSNSVLIRRIGKNQELRIPLRLDKIMAGTEPEVLLRPDDVIAVGTHIASPFLAVIRNGFRMTYGFGFLYDRNFSEKNYGQQEDFEDIWRW